MPIEIKELVIRATIDTEKSTANRPRGLSSEDEKKKINQLTRRIEEMQHMIMQKNER